jgi:hypothetical protein
MYLFNGDGGTDREGDFVFFSHFIFFREEAFGFTIVDIRDREQDRDAIKRKDTSNACHFV